MAGRGPAPAENRRRRNEPARGEWVDLPPLERPVLPELPERTDGEAWSGRAVTLWAAWRADPVTQVWSPADIAYALDTIALYEAAADSKPNEVRLRMDGLGLTPKGKRDLRYRVASAPVEQQSVKRPAKKSSSRRARLSVVK